MNISIEDKRKEAIERMKMMDIYNPTIKQFERGTLSQSEPPLGACFWVEGEQLDRIREFEEKHNALVYHVIFTPASFGDIENYLCVGDNADEWPVERSCIKKNMPLVYSYNRAHPEWSEFGTIGIEGTPAGGVLRTW